MKCFGHLVEQIASLDNLALAFCKAQLGKKAQREVVAYRNNLNENLQRLSSQITTGEVVVGRYRKFIITDPKRREICAAAFDERVLHHAIMNICHPIFERNLIYDTYATRLGKGIYSALERARKAMTRYAYVAKLDVRKYFDSISHDILKQQLRRLFKDATLLHILDLIIDSHESHDGKGLPIGNLTSQYFANFYLSGLDHYVKEDLHVPVYVRYMDDILVFGQSHEEVGRAVRAIVSFVKIRLHLVFKPPILVSTTQGIPFLGYKLQSYVIHLNGRSKSRFRKKLILYHHLLANSVWDEQTFLDHVLPLLAFVKWAYSKRYRKKAIALAEGQELKGSEPCASWR